MRLCSKERWTRPQRVSSLLACLLMAIAGPARLQALQVASPPAGSTAQTGLPAQPALDVDRDPVPSPDPDPPAQPVSNQAPATALGAIARGSGGRFTLREDAYEV